MVSPKKVFLEFVDFRLFVDNDDLYAPHIAEIDHLLRGHDGGNHSVMRAARVNPAQTDPAQYSERGRDYLYARSDDEEAQE